MFIIRGFDLFIGITLERNRRSGKIESEIIFIKDGLDVIGILYLLGTDNLIYERRHRQSRVVQQRLRHLLDHLGRKQRLVTLDIDDHVMFGNFKNFGRLGQSVGTGNMIFSGHNIFPPKLVDTLGNARIVGCDNHSGEQFDRLRSFHDMLNHRLTSNFGQRFSRKSI